MNDRPRIATLVAEMASTLGVRIDRERIRGYVDALVDLPADRVEIGIRRAMDGWRFGDIPKPSDIRDAVDSFRHPVTVWPHGWQAHCPHGTCVIPTQCPEAWAWVKALVLAVVPA